MSHHISKCHKLGSENMGLWFTKRANQIIIALGIGTKVKLRKRGTCPFLVENFIFTLDFFSVSLLAIVSIIDLIDKIFKPSTSHRDQDLSHTSRQIQQNILDIPIDKSESINSDLPQLYKDRRKHVADVCDKHHDRLEADYKRFQPSKNFQNVVSKVDVFHSRNKNPFLWCRVPKASSQSWNDLFISVW